AIYVTGVQTCTLPIFAAGGLQISGTSPKNLNQRMLTNSAMATWTGTGSLQVGAGSAISNTAAGTFDAQSDAQIIAGFGGTASFKIGRASCREGRLRPV